MKVFHIMNVGVSIITNYQKAGKIENRPVSDNQFWNARLDDRSFLNKISEFVLADPWRNSAELNSFLRIINKEGFKDNEIYLVGTKTPINEICVRTVERYFKEQNYLLYTPKEVSGYFWESEKFSENFAKEEFVKDISLLIDKLIYLAQKKKKDGYKVIFNPTAGLKAHVIASAIAGFLTNSPVYYIHEEFQDIVKLPDLFYLPKGKEIYLLEKLSDKVPRSGREFEKLDKEFSDEIERLEAYNMVELESDEGLKPYRIRITNKGLLFLENLRKGR